MCQQNPQPFHWGFCGASQSVPLKAVCSSCMHWGNKMTGLLYNFPGLAVTKQVVGCLWKRTDMRHLCCHGFPHSKWSAQSVCLDNKMPLVVVIISTSSISCGSFSKWSLVLINIVLNLLLCLCHYVLMAILFLFTRFWLLTECKVSHDWFKP